MAMNPLPPQAYTKDSLLKAYSWLQNQDASIKEMATTPDILVSLYLKATRDGDAVLERPSIQNFKHELKQLAGMMGEFDKEVIEEKIQKEKNKTTQVTPNSLDKVLESFHTMPSSMPKENVLPMLGSSPSALPFKSIDAEGLNKKGDTSLVGGLDSKSLMLISEVKNNLNLSSDLEALKFLIQTGYNRAKKLF